MKKIAIILALALCLSLLGCAPSQDPNTDSSSSSSSSSSDGAASNALYDHTLNHPMKESLYGQWNIETNNSLFVMPDKIVFYEDGTCYVEFPDYALEQTKTLRWGIVRDSVNAGKLYVRIGVEDNVWYLFSCSNSDEASIAEYSNDPAEMLPIDGLSEDGYIGMWFEMVRAEE